MGWSKFIEFSMEVTLGALHIITGIDATGLLLSAARGPSWFLRYDCRSLKRLCRISPNLIGLTYIYLRTYSRKTWLYQLLPFNSRRHFKIFCTKWTTGHRSQIWYRCHRNTFINFSEHGASSYFRSATIHHVDFLHYVIAVLNGLTEFHQIQYALSSNYIMSDTFRQRFTHHLGKTLNCTLAALRVTPEGKG